MIFISHASADDAPVEELVLKLTDPTFETTDVKRRARATATLVYKPAQSGARGIESQRYPFIAPLGPIETEDLRWYLESYHIWPVGVFQDRAEGIAKKLPVWGRALFQAALGDEEAREAFYAWQYAQNAERRFSVQVDGDLPKGAPEEARAAAREAATELLSLPWELVHDGRTWLFQGKNAVRVRRRLPHRQAQPARPTTLPIRILLVSARPERDDHGNSIDYFDHRVSARPLTDAVESLGALARLTVLQPPTYGALEKALRAGDEGQPFDVVHFDGHGVYDRRLGLGGLCFEDSADEDRWERRRMDFVDAERLAGLVRDYRVPLVFLEACQTAVAEVDPTASVAAKLLGEGVTSVVAMSHSVLVETSRRFVKAFYDELAQGERVGRAMLAGQQALFADDRRGKILGAGELRLQDWFVPVLYQEEQDPQLLTKLPPEDVKREEAKKRTLSLGALPEPPPHAFQGRSRELLALERLLHREPWAVVRGTGGQGKTTLAVELARWLTRTARFARAAFVSLEHHHHPQAVLDTLGHQLLPEGDKYSVAQFPSLDKALQPVERALADQPTIVVLDNCESVLPETAIVDEIFTLCQRLLAADPRTRLVFTTREPLPAPFDARGRERELGALDPDDAVKLVGEVMKQNGWTPPSDDAGTTPEEITALVEAVHCHARALVLLAPEVARGGVKAATGDLRKLMAELERKHPGDRENSLYASVELSLRRLPAESREHVKALAVCHGGVHLGVLQLLTGLGWDSAIQLVSDLIGLGLGEDMGYGHLRLDPGLSPYLLNKLPQDEARVLHSRWAEAMASLTRVLYKMLFQDAQFAKQLTLLELPNFLEMLSLSLSLQVEELVDLAIKVEALVIDLGRPQALARATRVREQAARALEEWSHTRFLAEDAAINRLIERGDLPAAYAAIQDLLTRGLSVGEAAYPEAAYDLATMHWRLGRVLHWEGSAEAALIPLAKAQRRFQALADAGDEDAQLMAGTASFETGDCLHSLGQLDAAAEIFEREIELDRKAGRLRNAAVGNFKLGEVRLSQKLHEDALDIYAASLESFERLGEPRQVAKVWHQTGRAYEGAGQHELAEQAYRRSLAISVRENDLRDQANTLNQLGGLYGTTGHLEEALTFFRQATEANVRLRNLANEGKSRGNLASTLTRLGRYDEARQELWRAIECLRPYGHAAESWKTWAILENLERTTGHIEAAQEARRQATETYLAYRRAGGVSQSKRAQLFDLVAEAIQEKTEERAAQQLNDLLEDDDPPHFTALIWQLQRILGGERDLALAEEPELDWANAAELRLLLEGLDEQKPDEPPGDEVARL